MTSAELIAALQAARPIVDGPLRERVREIAAAAPAPQPSPFGRLWRVAPRRVALIAVPAAAVVLLGLAGITGLLDPGSGPQSPAALTAGDREPKGATGSVQELTPRLEAGTGPAAPAPAPDTGRAQRYSAQLTLSVKDVDALSNATQRALQITRDLGGHLVTASYATSDTGVSSLTLEVPTANVQDAIVRFSALGKIVAQQVQIDDLQGQVDELKKRETALRERIARLSARLGGPGLDAETRAALEARRDAARNELGRVRAGRAQVGAEARFATIQLGLQTRQSSLVPVVPSRFDRALDRAGEILAVEATVALYALVIAGPLALLASLAWLGRRGLRRRQDEQLLSTP